MKKYISILMVAALCIVYMPVTESAFALEENNKQISGKDINHNTNSLKGVANPSREEIRSYLSTHPFSLTERDTYSIQPDYGNEVVGCLDQKTFNATLNSLKFARYIAGMYTDVSIDKEFSKKANAASTYFAGTNQFGHRLSKVNGVSYDFYNLANDGAGSSNIGRGYINSPNTIWGYMSDESDKNRRSVGHRRWCLNPQMGKVGFGSCNRYYAMHCIGGDKQSQNHYSYTAWPINNMPIEYFNGPWSFQYDKKRYSMGNNVEIQVTMPDGAIKVFKDRDKDYYANEINYGRSSALIFAPLKDAPTMRLNDGPYRQTKFKNEWLEKDFKVRIKGLVDRRAGSAEEISYNVNFFNIDPNKGNGSGSKSRMKYIGGKWYLFRPDGTKVSNAMRLYKNHWYLLRKDGSVVMNAMRLYKNHWYLLRKDGSVVMNAMKKYKGKWYLLDKEGYMVTNRRVNYKGITYRIDKYGVAHW